MKLTYAIVDDEPLALSLLESYVKKTPFLQLEGSYSNALQADEGLSETPVDLLFLDIQMPQSNGLLFAQHCSSDMRIIFTTAFSQYAVDSYRVNAIDYLLKPFSYEEFLSASEKALKWFELTRQNLQEQTKPDVIFVKSERKLVRIELDKLLYVEVMRDYMKFVLEGDELPIFSLMSLKSLIDLLPPDKFIRVHRSFIVQKSKIGLVSNNHIVFGKVQVPIGGLYKTDFAHYMDDMKLS